MKPEVVEGFRLSTQQKHAWLSGRKDPARHAVCAILVEGLLEVEKLQEALKLLVERHEILRTTFQFLPGMTFPIQVIAEGLPPAFRQLESLADGELEANRIERILATESSDAFDYKHGPLLRVTLLPSAPERHVIVMCLPSLCADRLTLRNLFAELGRCYGAASGIWTLADAPMQYADYAEWQNEILFSNSAEAEVASGFWRHNGRESQPGSRLRFQEQPAGNNQFTSASFGFQLDADLSLRVPAHARALNTSEDVLLFTCWQMLLRKLTGALEVWSNKLFSGRSFEELHEAVGLFARYLPLRTRIDDDASISALLERVGEATHSADEWFEYVVVDYGSEVARCEQSPLYGFDYEVIAGEKTKAGGVSFAPLMQSECIEPFDLRLSCVRAGHALRGILHYNRAVFRTEDIERLAQRFEILLGDAIVHPAKVVDQLEILGRPERRKLLVELNDTKTDDLGGDCIQQLFESRGRQNPESVAVISRQEQLSYRELNCRANRLAHYLRGRGTKPEVCVGLCVERSPRLVVAMLAVLKAGGAYVPLDADYPARRRAGIIADTELGVVLTQQHLKHLWRDFAGEVICLDSDEPLFAEEPESDLPVTMSPDNLAYVMHTSGSTGQPKGVLATHRGAVNYLRYLAEEFLLNEHDVVLQLASPTFDASVREIFGTLSAGATLVMLDQAERKEPAAILSSIRENGVTALLGIVPTMLGALFDAVAGFEAGSLETMRLILSSGEPLPASYCHLAREMFGERLLVVNQYGPTECAMTSSFYPVPGQLAGGETVPVGRPIRNRQIFLLDKRSELAAFGVAGEVYIGGSGMARGYLNHADLTAQNFVPDPFGKEPGARLYRTGDRGRYRADGQIEFLGRLDRQVKLRGLRIEPGEIEAALTEHPAVKTAAVVMREDEPGSQRLVAYVEPTKSAAARADRHRRYRLPNGTVIAQQSQVETDFMYDEIFNEQVYLRHGLTLHDGDIVFDVGANVGLFTLFVHQHCKDSTIFAFEPAPPLFEILSSNADYHGINVKLFNVGLSDKAKDLPFTFYPKSSGMSSFYAEADEEKEVLRSIMANQLKNGAAELETLMEHSEALLEDRFRNELFTCHLKTISQVIEDEDIERIDLLKIDAQKSEFDILEGIRLDHWKKIGQVVMEVHDVGGRLRRVISLLEERGFEVTTEQDEVFSGSVLHYVYARAPEARQVSRDQRPAQRRPAAVARADGLLTITELREFLKDRLPEYMLPSVFILLETMPLTLTGKVDRRALPAPEQMRPALSQHYVAPRTPVETELAEIWAQLLAIECAGIHDNFFELGGHSLLVIQLAARISESFQINLPMARLFETPTIAQLALLVTQAQAEQEDGAELAQLLAELKEQSEGALTNEG